MTAFQQFIIPAFHQFIRFTPATQQLINSSREPPKIRLSRAKGSPQKNQPQGRGLRFPLRPPLEAQHPSRGFKREKEELQHLGAWGYSPAGGLGEASPSESLRSNDEPKESHMTKDSVSTEASKRAEIQKGRAG